MISLEDAYYIFKKKYPNNIPRMIYTPANNKFFTVSIADTNNWNSPDFPSTAIAVIRENNGKIIITEEDGLNVSKDVEELYMEDIKCNGKGSRTYWYDELRKRFGD